MKSGSEGLVASSEAYEVLRAIAEEIGSENNIVDLELFSFNMDRSCGHPVDPAFESEWGFYWGPAVALSPEDSFRVAVQFMNFELGWTKNVLLREFMKEAEKSAREPESAPAGLLWDRYYEQLTGDAPGKEL